MVAPTRVVGIFLVDSLGRVLLQERDEHAPIAPEQWGIVGGHVDPGEEWQAARDRELLEETGLALADGTLELWYAGVVDHLEPGSSTDWRLYVGSAGELTDGDIVCGEGRRIVFVEPAVARTLDLTASAATSVPGFLDSPLYASMTR